MIICYYKMIIYDYLWLLMIINDHLWFMWIIIYGYYDYL